MRRWIKAIVLVGLLGGGGLLVFRRAPLPVTARLSDGSVFEVTKITSGPVHRFRYRYDDRWQDYFGQLIPKSLLAKFPPTLRANLTPHVVDYTITNAGAIVWTTSHDPTFSRNSARIFEVTVADQHGVEVRSMSGAQRLISFSGVKATLPMLITPLRATNSVVFTSAGGGSITSTIPTLGLTRSTGIYVITPGGPLIVTTPTATISPRAASFSMNAWPIVSLPRHSREITLGFSASGGQRFAELKTRNPAYHRPGALRPESLPQVKFAGDVQIAMQNLQASKFSVYSRRVNWDVNVGLLRNGQPVTDWKPFSLQVFDDAGALILSRPELGWSRIDLRSPELATFRFEGLWPGTAWRLRFWAAPETGISNLDITRFADFIVQPTWAGPGGVTNSPAK